MTPIFQHASGVGFSSTFLFKRKRDSNSTDLTRWVSWRYCLRPISSRPSGRSNSLWEMARPPNWTREERRFLPEIGAVSTVKFFPSISMREVKEDDSISFRLPDLQILVVIRSKTKSTAKTRRRQVKAKKPKIFPFSWRLRAFAVNNAQ